MGTSAAAAAFAEADVVLLAGTKSSGGATYGWTLPRDGQLVVQLDIDPAELGRAFGVTAAMLADARQGVTALLAELGTGAAPAGPRTGPAPAPAAKPSRTGPPGGPG